MRVLVTGGAGFIGSHCVVELISNGFEPVIFDNFSNAFPSVIGRIGKIAHKQPEFIVGDITDRESLKCAFQAFSFDAVLHCAGLKSVAESQSNPHEYLRINVAGTCNLLREMQAANVRKFVFSSSATVYGAPDYLPMDEAHPLVPINNYGLTKLAVETELLQLANNETGWSAISLRYFNPAGAHPSGLLAENPKGKPNNLFPYLMAVALRRTENLVIFGDDYDTKDGTGERDYIHVSDLAKAHVESLRQSRKPGFFVYNVGTGIPYSVLDVVAAFKKATGIEIPYEITGRRAGDLPRYFSTPAAMMQATDWAPKRNLEDMCRDLWASRNAYLDEENSTALSVKRRNKVF